MLLFLKKDHITIDELILFYALYMFLKAIFVSFKYSYFLKFKFFIINFSNLKFGLPFLLIGITGFLHSKIDIYTYAFFQNNIALGEYQIISSFFIFSQSIITILLFPYIKNIYRINIKSIKKIRFQIAFLGVFFNSIITLIIAYCLENYFDITLTPFEYLIGFFIGYPTYIYSIKILELFKFNKERKVVIISIIGLFLNLILSIIFLFLDLNTLGVLLANAITQIMTMFFYSFLFKK
ncbi:hypothetical protein [Tenacibaculum retecalamus]|uniref:hypothetical protein n=1 Tax=Tenacibaculum retecalamus TaxID=3018315 RepID=UPI0023D96D3E|nr:hypothetical protein [Tenacibaculum retecalamus]WBX71658.1 hypothetical protein PG912_02390 [Tenacibaculum retecalamus]